MAKIPKRVSAVLPVTTLVLASSCGGGLNQTSITCAEGRTLLDGVCVSEQVADYVSCVRAQGAQLGSERGQKVSAEVGQLGIKAGGAAEINETLQKKYSASDQAMLAIIQACSATSALETGASRKPSAKSLAAHWTFDEAGGTGVSDQSGNGNTGTLKGTPAWVAGRIGGGLKFDGAQSIEVVDAPSQHWPRAITLTGWFLLTKKDIGHPWRDLFIKTNPKGPNWWGCLLPGEPDANPCDEREYGAVVNVDELYLGVYGVTEDKYRNGGQTWCTTPPKTVQFDKWHQFAGVITPRSRAIRLFLDGNLMATCPLSEAGLRRTSQQLRIGASWVGILDDMRIWGTELTDQEIAELARAK